MVQQFQEFLERSDLSRNTIDSYVRTVNYFNSNFGVMTKKNLLVYKGFLLEHFKPQTINQRLNAINKYLEFDHKDKLKM